MVTSVALAVVSVFCALLFLLLMLMACAWKQSECDCEHWKNAHRTVTKGKDRVQAELERTKGMVEIERGRSRLLEDKLERIHSVFYPPVGTDDKEEDEE